MNRYDEIREKYRRKGELGLGDSLAFLETMADAYKIMEIINNPRNSEFVEPYMTMDWIEGVVDELVTRYPDGDRISRIACRIEVNAGLLEGILEAREARRIFGVPVGRILLRALRH